MSNLPVSSREYKLMLNVDRFKDREQGLDIFFKLIKSLVKKGGGECSSMQSDEQHRVTSYLDTPQLALSQNGYILRMREETLPADGFNLLLKYRSPDRYISASKDLSAPVENEHKFEEDILPPFISKFSHSAKITFQTAPDLSTVDKMAALYPGLKELDLDKNTVINTVNNFKVIEVVRKFCKFKFGGQKSVKASLNFWYTLDSEVEWPLIAEFSFNYDAIEGQTPDKPETFPTETVEGAYRLFSEAQKQSGWLNPNGTTKTAFALDVL